MPKLRILIPALITFGLGWGLTAAVMPAFNRAKITGELTDAYKLLMIPLMAQILWFGAGLLYGSMRKQREIVLGIFIGFGVEFVVLIVMALVASSAHY
jgi:hypothetical protein